MNSDLYGQIVGKVPPHILRQMGEKLKYSSPNTKGYEQCSNIINNPELSYSLAKFMKHYFDHYSAIKDSIDEFELRGGHGMKRWLEQALNKSRGEINRRKETRSTVFNNQFIKSHDKTFDKPTSLNIFTSNGKGLNENEGKEDENQYDKYKYTQASIGLLYNDSGEILMLRRSKTDSWMPLKYAFVGGKVEKDETPKQALSREVKEEVNLNIVKSNFCFKKNDNDLELNYFICSCSNPDDVKLSNEHDDYVWCTMEYLDNLELVPNVKNDIQKALNSI
jgi:8-oxo-dGTP diphosphatase